MTQYGFIVPFLDLGNPYAYPFMPLKTNETLFIGEAENDRYGYIKGFFSTSIEAWGFFRGYY
jgi:hypothetical protein